MRPRALLAAVMTIGTAALAAAPAQAAPAQVAPPACPGTFTVLHDDRIGSVAFPAGSYALTVFDPATLSCGSAATAFRRFLEDFDGKLPSPWRLTAPATFTGPAGAGFTVAPVVTPSGGGGGTHPAAGLTCPGTFRVLHDDRIGRLRLPAGRYRVTLGAAAPVSCPGSSRALARFLARPSGRLPRGWRLAPATGTFSRNGVVAFRIKPAS